MADNTTTAAADQTPQAAMTQQADDTSAPPHGCHRRWGRRDWWTRKYKTPEPSEGDTPSPQASEMPIDLEHPDKQAAPQDFHHSRRHGGRYCWRSAETRPNPGEATPGEFVPDPSQFVPFRGGYPPFHGYRHRGFYGGGCQQGGPDSGYMFREFDFL